MSQADCSTAGDRSAEHTESMVRVLVVARGERLRIGVKMLLEATGRIEVTGMARSLGELADFDDHSYETVVFDMSFGSTSEVLRRDFPKDVSRLVILLPDSVADPELSEIALARPGAILGRNGPTDELTAAIRSVSDGNSWVSPEIGARLLALADGRSLARRSLAVLTSRERQILAKIAAGGSNHEIAKELSLTIRTVKYHVSNLLTKLGARDRAHAVALAYGLGPDE